MQNPHCCQAAAASLSDAIGCRGFYEHLIPEFGRSPTDPLHLLLLLKGLSRTLGNERSGSSSGSRPHAANHRNGVRRQPELPLPHRLPDHPDGLRPLSLLYVFTVPALVL